MNRTFRLVDAVVVLLLMMLPVMLLVGAAEGRIGGPTLLFWLLLTLPLVVLGWLLLCCDPEEGAQGHRAAAVRVPRDSSVAAEFAGLIAPFVRPGLSYVEEGVPVVEGVPKVKRSELFRKLDDRLSPRKVVPLVEAVDGQSVRVVGLPRAVEARLRARPSIAINVLLFAATVVTTVYAGARQQGVNLFTSPADFAVGVPYAFALLSILGVHEMGHYVMARRHHVDVTPPYFIPVPMGLGTFGAFIQIKSLISSRRAVFDIGVAGPLAGLAVALPLLYVELGSPASIVEGTGAGMPTGVSLLLALMYQFAVGGELGTAVVTLSPVAFAAWIGIFVTALNLLPVGQLDGGHIAYAMFGGRHARTISVLTIALMVGFGLTVWPGLLTWALIVTLIAGFSHLPALDDVTPVGRPRFALGVIALAIGLLILAPVPDAVGDITLDSPYQG